MRSWLRIEAALHSTRLVVRKRIDVDDDLDHRRRGSVSAGHDVMTADLKGLAAPGCALR